MGNTAQSGLLFDANGNLLVSNATGPQKLAQSGIAFVWGPTGTMANNGADTLGTALPTTYANGYILLPAGAIAAGVPAAVTWYFFQASSTTALTIFNNTYTSGIPTVPASPTAFVTTGPGAYTGVTGAQAGPTISVAGGSLGVNGAIRVRHYWSVPNNANTKNPLISYGGTTFYNASGASLAGLYSEHLIVNRGVANAQIGAPSNSIGLGTGTGGAGTFVYGSVNSANAQNLILQAKLAVATDFVVLEGFAAEVLSG